MADLTISVDIDASGTKRGGTQAKSAIKDIGDEAEKTGRKVKSVADRDMGALDKQAAAAAKSVSATSGSLSGLAAIGGPAAAVVAAIGAALLVVVTVAIALAQKIVQLTMAFVGYVKEIKSARDETGLTVQVLSGLKVGIESVGGKFEDLTSGLKNYIKTIGDANNGSKEASAKLVRLGIDADGAARNFDGALRQVFAKIASLPEGVQRTNAAIDAFGDSAGPKLLPMIKQFNGNIDAMIAQAKKLGLVLSDDDVKAAAEFEKSLASVKLSLKALENAFGREFMPVVKQVLDNVTLWLNANQGNFQNWAAYAGNAIRALIDDLALLEQWVVDHETTIRIVLGIATLGGSEAALATMRLLGETIDNVSAKGARLRSQQPISNYDPSLNPDMPGLMGPMYNNPGLPKAGRTPRGGNAAAPQISDQAKQAQDLAKMISDLSIELSFFGQESEESAMRQQLLKKGIFDVNQGLANQLINLAKQKDGLIANAEAAKKAAESQLAFKKAIEGVSNKGFDDRVNAAEEQWNLSMQVDLGRELTDLERQQIANAAELVRVREQARREGFSEAQLNQLEQEILKQQELTNVILTKNQELRETIRIQQLNNQLTEDMSAEIADLNAQIRENAGLTALSRVETLLLSDAYKQLTPEMQAARMEQAKQIDGLRETIKAQEETKRKYDEMFGTIRDSLDVLANQGFGAFFKNILRKFQQFAVDMVSAWLTSKFFKMFYQGGNSQAAAASGQGGGGILGSIQNAIFGNGAANGPGGTPNWNPAAGGVGGSIFSQTPGSTGSINSNGEYVVNGGGSGSGFSLFGGGLTNGIGTVASLGMIAGGAIGGKAGNLISSVAGGALTGLMLGAKFGAIGGPLGAAIGAAAGFAMSILGGLFSSPKRKRDKNEKMPQLQKGFLDALTQLKALAADKNAILSNPSGAMSKADELRAAIASGFGIQFESKKYGKIAQQQIAQKLAEADVLVKQIKEFAEVSRAANERDRRLIPEFAGGVYMSPAFMSFRRRNGMLGGSFTGRDTIPAMLGPGEAVLNPRQMATIKAQAGFDVFKTAGIPGYAAGAMMPASFPSQTMQMGDVNVTVVVEQDAEGMWHATAQSAAGQKVIAKVVSNGFANDEIKTKRRGA